MYDSDHNKFLVHKPTETIHFKMSQEGLFYHDTKKCDITFINTVEENKSMFSQCDYENVKQARELYAQVGFLSMKDYINMVEFKLIDNCPITARDIFNTQKIFGKDMHALKGKTVRIKPETVKTDYYQLS